MTWPPEGCVDVVLVYSPDRLARKFAYQALLIEELARAGLQHSYRPSSGAPFTIDAPLAGHPARKARVRRVAKLMGGWAGSRPPAAATWP